MKEQVPFYTSMCIILAEAVIGYTLKTNRSQWPRSSFYVNDNSQIKRRSTNVNSSQLKPPLPHAVTSIFDQRFGITIHLILYY